MGWTIPANEGGLGNLAEPGGFVALIFECLPDPQGFLHGALSGVEAELGGRLVTLLAGSFAFELADDADVLS